MHYITLVWYCVQYCVWCSTYNVDIVLQRECRAVPSFGIVQYSGAGQYLS
jgi:hypothetical protein